MDLRPVVMLRVKNIRAGDRDMLTDIRHRNLVRVVLTGGDRVWLSNWANTDYLNDKIAVLV